jgi:hypothetical protein
MGPTEMGLRIGAEARATMQGPCYKEPQAEKAAELAGERLGPEAAFQALFREALKVLRSGA